MKYEIRFTSQFKKDLKAAKKQKRDMEKLYNVIEMIADGKTLDEKYRDHELTGKYAGTRECHVSPDWLLIYEIRDNILVLMLNRVARIPICSGDRAIYSFLTDVRFQPFE